MCRCTLKITYLGMQHFFNECIQLNALKCIFMTGWQSYTCSTHQGICVR